MKKTPRRIVRHDLMTQTEAAALLGVTRNTVLAMYSRGQIGGEMVAGTLYPKRTDVESVQPKRAA